MICVYKILSPDLKECYVGSTTDFVERQIKHKVPTNDCASKILFNKYGLDNCPFVVLEQCTKEELRKKEQWWQDHSVGLVNFRNALLTKEQRKEDRTKQNKRYYEANKEKERLRMKAYREARKLKSI
jgi:group I intron endonuclease